MLPLRLLKDRNRSGSYLVVLFIGAGLMATYYLLTLYMQQVLGFSPVLAGIASLPVSVGIVASAGVSTKLVERLAPRLVAVPGLALAAAGMLWLSTLSVGSSYIWHVLPALFVSCRRTSYDSAHQRLHSAFMAAAGMMLLAIVIVLAMVRTRWTQRASTG